MKILVVDDDVLVQTSISKKLYEMGHEVTQMSNGLKALQIVKEEKFDLIISDIIMPGLSGFDLLNLLKRFYLNKVPIIIMSSLSEKEMINLSFELGANNFISKPINFKELDKKMNELSLN